MSEPSPDESLPGLSGPLTVNPDPLLSLLQAGEYLGCSDELVRQEIIAGRIAVIRMGQPGTRTRMRVRRSELEAYIERSTTPSARNIP